MGIGGAIKAAAFRGVLGPAMAFERMARGGRFTTRPEDVRSVLVLEYMLPLGCCVHLTPLYEALRACRPEMTITVATRGLGLALLRHHAYIDHLIETSDPLRDLGAAARTLSARLAELRIEPECVMTGVADQRTRIGLLGAMAGRGWRAGYTQAPLLYHRALEVDRAASQIANNLRLAKMLGCDGRHREPRIFFSAADAAKAEAMTREVNPLGRPLLVMVTQTSGGQRTGWRLERFLQVIREAHDAFDCAIAYVGTAADAAAIESIQEAAGGTGVSLAGRTSVTELAALLAMSDYVVSLDTGTMHVARAAGVPMVVLGPSWQRPAEWMPLGVPQARILRGPDRDDVPPGYQLDEISAEDVCSALAELLQRYPANREARDARVARSLSSVDHLGG